MNRTAILKSIAALALTAGLLTAPGAPAFAEPAAPVAVELRIENVVAGRGSLRIAMFDERNWLSNQVVIAARTQAAGETVRVRLNAPGAGRYGLAIYQDVNGDGRLNRNMVGIPTEPYAFSNNAPANFGPPAFSAAAFTVGEQGGATAVRLRR